MTKTLKPIIIALLAIITFNSCSGIRDTMNSARPVNLSSLKLGMSKEEVQKQLNKKPDNIVAVKNYPDTKIYVEVVQYSEAGKKIESYWLYFVNNKLDKWEIASKEYKPRI